MFHALLETFWPSWNTQTQDTTPNQTPTTNNSNISQTNSQTAIAAQEIANAILKIITNEGSNREHTPLEYAVVIFESRSWLVIKQKLNSIDQTKLNTEYQKKIVQSWLDNIDIIEKNYNTLQGCVRELNKPNSTTGTAAQKRLQQDQENRIKIALATENLTILKESLLSNLLQETTLIRKYSKVTNTIFAPDFSEALLTIYSQWHHLWAFHHLEGVSLQSHQTFHGKAFKITQEKGYQEFQDYIKECGYACAVKAAYGLKEQNLYVIPNPYNDDHSSVGKVESFTQCFAPTSPFIGKGSKINYSYVTPSEIQMKPIDDKDVTKQANIIQQIFEAALSIVNTKLSSGLRRFHGIQMLK